MSDPQEFAPRAVECARGRIICLPLGNDAVKGDIGVAETRWYEIGRPRAGERSFAMRCVEQPVLRKLGMKGETYKAALEPAVDRQGKRDAKIRVDRGLLSTIEQI